MTDADIDAFEVFQRCKDALVDIPACEFHVEQPDEHPEAVFEFDTLPGMADPPHLADDMADALDAEAVQTYEAETGHTFRFYFAEDESWLADDPDLDAEDIAEAVGEAEDPCETPAYFGGGDFEITTSATTDHHGIGTASPEAFTADTEAFTARANIDHETRQLKLRLLAESGVIADVSVMGNGRFDADAYDLPADFMVQDLTVTQPDDSTRTTYEATGQFADDNTEYTVGWEADIE